MSKDTSYEEKLQRALKKKHFDEDIRSTLNIKKRPYQAFKEDRFFKLELCFDDIYNMFSAVLDDLEDLKEGDSKGDLAEFNLKKALSDELESFLEDQFKEEVEHIGSMLEGYYDFYFDYIDPETVREHFEMVVGSFPDDYGESEDVYSTRFMDIFSSDNDNRSQIIEKMVDKAKYAYDVKSFDFADGDGKMSDYVFSKEIFEKIEDLISREKYAAAALVCVSFQYLFNPDRELVPIEAFAYMIKNHITIADTLDLFDLYDSYGFK